LQLFLCCPLYIFLSVLSQSLLSEVSSDYITCQANFF
jgi:hypothetical protein